MGKAGVKLGNVDCWKKGDPELINQHLLCEGGQFKKLELEEQNCEKRAI